MIAALQRHVWITLRGALDEGLAMLALIGEHGAHGEEVETDEDRRVEADMADGVVGTMVGDEQVHAGEADQNDAKARRQNVALMRPPIDRHLPIHEVDGNQDQEVEDAAAENVANGDVRLISHGHGADARDQLGKRGDRAKQDQADPISGDTGLVGVMSPLPATVPVQRRR